MVGHGFEDCKPLKETKVLTVAAGGIFVFLSTLWPCAWYWHHKGRQSNWQFTPVLLYAMVLALFYVGIAAALASQVKEHFHLIRHSDHEHFQWNSSSSGGYPYNCDHDGALVIFWVFVPMEALLVVITLCSILLCVCCRVAGRVF